MAKVLVLRDLSKKINVDLLRNNLHIPILANTYPKDGAGVAIIDADTEPDWDWADITIVVGTVETGTHEVDIKIGANEDVEGAIIEYLRTVDDSDVAES